MNCDVHNDVIYNNYYHSLIALWGHCQEGYGEDPYLYVTALQNSPNSSYIEAVVYCEYIFTIYYCLNDNDPKEL